jgi:nucleoside-diphosphate-sugar epimerase
VAGTEAAIAPNFPFDLKTIVVRLPNPYGIRQQMKHNKYSLVGWFLRQALDGGTITIFGDGKQTRDYLYIDDIVEGLLLLAKKGVAGEIYNMGSKEKVTFVEMVDAVLKEAGTGKKEHSPWPGNYEKNETGDYFADTTKIKKDTGWEAKICLKNGIERMAEYYKKYKKSHW